MGNRTSVKVLAVLSLLGFAKLGTAGTMGPAEIRTWTGAYVGINAGALWGSSDFYTTGYGSDYSTEYTNFLNRYLPVTLDNTAFLGGGQIGANYQFGSWVLGVEGDFDYAHLNGSRNVLLPENGTGAGPFNLMQSFTTDWISTVRGRLGYSQGAMLFFGTAGLAITSVQNSDSFTDSPVFVSRTENIMSQEKTVTGWSAGAGLEWMFSSNLSFKAEYLYADFGNVSYTNLTFNGGILLPNAAFVNNHELTANIFRFGANYKFNI